MQKKLLPVLLGADMNCYSMARAFHEAYGVCSQAFGRYAMGETKYSRIVHFTVVENMDTDAVLLETLSAFAAQHPDETKILLGCTDDYAAMLIRNQAALQQEYIVPYIAPQLAERLVSKENFYRYCDEYDIPYPQTVVLRRGEGLSAIDLLPFAFPVILKPSSSIAYWKHPFNGMKKVYVAHTADEAKGIAQRIFAAGYDDALLVQDRVPGPDCRMRVLTAYSGQDGKVQMMCLGNVLLEEHTPKALGNHAAILTEHNRPLMEKLQAFLDAIGYTGFSNFDIKYDERDGSYRVFEINLRQGRSNYYVTGAGLNLAKYLVEDRVLGQPAGPPLLYEGTSFWHSIPKRIVWEYTADTTLVAAAKAIAGAGKDTTTLGYSYDLRGNPRRRLYTLVHDYRYYRKYAIWCEKPGATGQRR